jgi:hypothetical protein
MFSRRKWFEQNYSYWSAKSLLVHRISWLYFTDWKTVSEELNWKNNMIVLFAVI